MLGVEFVQKDDEIFAIIVRREVWSEEKYNFMTPEEFPFQLGANFYKSGETIKRHNHPEKPVTLRTVQEFIVVAKGRLKASIFDHDQQLIREELLGAGDVILLTAGGHGFEVLDDTSIVEVKQGPYAGSKDKTFF